MGFRVARKLRIRHFGLVYRTMPYFRTSVKSQRHYLMHWKKKIRLFIKKTNENERQEMRGLVYGFDNCNGLVDGTKK